MKKGINFWSFGPGITIERAIQLTAEAGFEGIELCVDNAGPLTPETSDEDVLELKGLVSKHGLEVASVASGIPWECPITSNDPDTRKYAITSARRQIEVAALLEGGAILLVPGYAGCDFQPGAEVVPITDALSRAREAIAELVPVAENAGIDIGIENVWNKMLQGATEMRDFIDSFGSDRVGSYFDVANVIPNGYSDDWIRVLGSRIRRVHLKDYRRAVGTVDGFVGLLNGDVEFPAIMTALKETGYDGYCTAEIIPQFRHHQEAMAFMTSTAMDFILERK